MILNNGFAWAIVIVVALGASIACHSTAQNEGTVVHVPVLSACKGEVIGSLRGIPRTSPFVGRYVPFDDTFRSHPELAGFLVLESSEYTRETLIQLAGGFTAPCFRLRNMAFAKSSEQEAMRLFDFLNHVSAGAVRLSDAGIEGRVDPEQVYVVNEPEALRVFFNLEN